MNALAAAREPPAPMAKNPNITGRLLWVEPTAVRPGGALEHFCPGCRMLHAFTVNLPDDRGALWRWNRNGDRPTFTPDMDVWPPGERPGRIPIPADVRAHLASFAPDRRCHYRLADGVIAFFPDCTHALAGKRVRLPPLPGYV
jgi:hypothetical protein